MSLSVPSCSLATVYVHARSNHPPNITKNIPLAINKRLVELSSDEETFENAKLPYQEALRKSGYQHELKYEHVAQKKQARKNRSRNIVWYNPPFSSNVKTNIGKAFIQIMKQSFPPGHPLRNIYNTNTLKLSYSCMPSIKNIIDGHNKKIRDDSKKNKEQESQEKTCNCRKPADCPLNGQYLTKSVIYQAAMTTEEDGSKEIYIGLTKNDFKERFNGHKAIFRHSNKRNNAELSKYVWKLKDQERQYNIKWAIIRRAKAYDNRSKRCQLCTLKKSATSSVALNLGHSANVMSWRLDAGTKQHTNTRT